jgi:hypothetical protein
MKIALVEPTSRVKAIFPDLMEREEAPSGKVLGTIPRTPIKPCVPVADSTATGIP